jgi:putative Holliday junction resolvase
MSAEYFMALDVGEKRIGVAVAHNIARFPRALPTLVRTDTVFDDVAKLVEAENVATVVVGLPRGMDGGYTAQTRSAEAFAHELETVLTVPVMLSDETLTSVQAEHDLKGTVHGKADIDALAACYILQGFLDGHPEGIVRT